MPKFKPHSGMKKRVKLTGSGKLRREQSSARKRRLEGSTAVSKNDVPRVKKMLGL
jgi:large subunit ribosomal protein L35